jgi:hypothetical protein
MFLRQISIEIRKTLKQLTLWLGYTQFLESFLAGIFHGADWAKWLFTNLHHCIMFLAGRPCEI